MGRGQEVQVQVPQVQIHADEDDMQERGPQKNSCSCRRSHQRHVPARISAGHAARLGVSQTRAAWLGAG